MLTPEVALRIAEISGTYISENKFNSKYLSEEQSSVAAS
jgi:hypothetical protein